MAHLTQQDRCKVENMLNSGVTPNEIATKLCKDHTTILREIRKHRQEEERKSMTNYCSMRKGCAKKNLCPHPPSSCPGRCSVCKIVACNKLCLDFNEAPCPKLARSPHVCNGCHELKNCRKRKFFYMAQPAMEEYRDTLVHSREGIDASLPEIEQYTALIRQGLRKGQSLHNIIASHPDEFQKCERSLYAYFNQGILPLSRGDMPRMCMRKPRKKPKVRHKIDPKFKFGRTLADFDLFRAEHPDFPVVQMDSVIGRIGGKVLLTIQFECGLMLACLRDTNNAQSVIDYFDRLESMFGLDLFQKMFPLILTDNGSEFSDPNRIEFSPLSGKRRTNVFYCDPYASWQKGSIENNHTNLRRILDKRASFDNLSQVDIDLVLSHLNSYIRRQYNDVPAILRFTEIYGQEVLERLNIRLIHSENVILDPILLKGKL